MTNPNIENHRRILRNSVFLYIRMLLILLVSLYSVRIVLGSLDVVDYGIYAAIGGVVFSLSFLSQILSSASQRFFAYELGLGDYGRLSKIFNTILISYIGIAALIIILAETVGLWFLANKMTIPVERLDAAYWVFQFSLLSFVVTILTNPHVAMLIAHERMNIYAYVGIFDVLLKLVVACVLIISPVDKLKLYAFLMFLVSCLIGIIYVSICRRLFRGIRLRLFWDKGLFKSVFSYSSWTLFGTVAGVFNNQGVNILLNLFFGPAVNASYAVGHQVSGAVSNFSSSFYTAVRPQLTKSYAVRDMEYMNQLFYFSSKTLFLLLYVIILPLMLETEFVLRIWLGNVKEYMVPFARLMLIYTAIICMSNPITTIAQASGNVKRYHGIVDGFALFVLPLSYFAFKVGCPPVYAFYISIAVFLIAHVLRLLVLSGIIEFSFRKYFSRFVMPALLTIIISGLVSRCAYSLLAGSSCRFVAIGLVSSILTCMLCYFILFNKEERLIARSLFCH